MDSFNIQILVFMVMVVAAVVLLASSIIVPTVSSQAQASRHLKRRLFSVLDSIDEHTASILRKRLYENLSPFERFLDYIPGMVNFRQVVEQSGVDTKACRIFVISVVSALFTFVTVSMASNTFLMPLLLATVIATLPVFYVFRMRDRRLAKFEEQLPNALTMMSRALEAGHPFNETIKMIGAEMPDPIASEFRQVFNDINYGLSSRAAFMSLMTRVPSMSVNTLVIAILIQTESGGRLSEIVSKIATVIRGRFKLNRRIRTLSAEGRLSAWILTLLPFVLAIVISISTPSYLPSMINDPMGRKMIGMSFLFILVGIFWMRKIIRFKY